MYDGKLSTSCHMEHKAVVVIRALEDSSDHTVFLFSLLAIRMFCNSVIIDMWLNSIWSDFLCNCILVKS